MTKKGTMTGSRLLHTFNSFSFADAKIARSNRLVVSHESSCDSQCNRPRTRGVAHLIPIYDALTLMLIMLGVEPVRFTMEDVKL